MLPFLYKSKLSNTLSPSLLRLFTRKYIATNQISDFEACSLKYVPTIGLEIHAQLNCAKKLFSDSNAKWDQSPNTQVSFFDLAIPGAMPKLNQNAVVAAARAILSLGGTLSKSSRFVRKHYFYPDQPAGYQITQTLQKYTLHKSNLNRLDTAKSIYDTMPGYGLIDFNRSGVALIEIITGPELRSSTEAEIFLKKLAQVLQISGASKALMEEGSLRCDVNVSVAPKTTQNSLVLGTKVEIKNLNSLKSVVGAIEAEIFRQINCLENQKPIVSETRSYNILEKTTYRSRSKESAPDYSLIQKIKESLPELPDSIKARLKQCGLTSTEIYTLMKFPKSVKFFDDTVKLGSNHRKVYSWLARDIFGILNYKNMKFSNRIMISPTELHDLITAIDESKLTTAMVKKILIEKSNGDNRHPLEIAKAHNWAVIQDDDSSLIQICKKIIDSNASQVENYKSSGNKRILGYFISQALKESKGLAKPQTLSKIFLDILSKK
ncbi:hypothetical protein BB561_006439 [Smittium simulii]|uniref:Glutamyl-tRNA(Gln) amidotransferase subunit B, mitochondrial n=1 Tax=Smittium simulii TaxID=133385 RepID=A0A2T9Y4C9_9FUNG|nr:hypothetical protein BB561_006439 [Smittium simulii]